jgi:U2 small nuclear ribonucleoprotein A'
MRLTVELINSALSYNNPCNERELNLRGHKIPNIENLGAARVSSIVAHERVEIKLNA